MLPSRSTTVECTTAATHLCSICQSSTAGEQIHVPAVELGRCSSGGFTSALCSTSSATKFTNAINLPTSAVGMRMRLTISPGSNILSTWRRVGSIWPATLHSWNKFPTSTRPPGGCARQSSRPPSGLLAQQRGRLRNVAGGTGDSLSVPPAPGRTYHAGRFLPGSSRAMRPSFRNFASGLSSHLVRGSERRFSFRWPAACPMAAARSAPCAQCFDPILDEGAASSPAARLASPPPPRADATVATRTSHAHGRPPARPTNA